jgi:mannose-6-phosphate isomerase-like protein (cupin superfamily)
MTTTDPRPAAAPWQFLAPVRPGDRLTAEARVVAVRADKPITTLATTIRTQDGVLVLDGTAVVWRDPVVADTAPAGDSKEVSPTISTGVSRWEDRHMDRMGLPEQPTAAAPDGSEVRVLLDTERGSMAHFAFPAGQVSQAVRHRTVDELWYFVAGAGRMWIEGGADDGFPVHPEVCVRIPAGSAFQVRADAQEPLAAVGVTMPPWPGPDEAQLVPGIWTPTLAPGS